MKSTTLVATVALLASALAASAHAQTGRPAAVEVPAAADTPQAATAEQATGSYARYLMLNGATRDEALVAARNIDHPSTRQFVASRSLARPQAPVPASR